MPTRPAPPASAPRRRPTSRRSRRATCRPRPAARTRPRTAAAIVGPTPSAAPISSSVAVAIAGIDAKCCASARAAVGPTCRMDSATITRQSAASLAFSRLPSSAAPVALRSPASRTAPATLERADSVNSGTLRSASASSANRSPSSVDHPGGQQRAGGLPAERLDVERAARRDVEQPLAQLRRAGPLVGAADVDVALLRGRQRRAARGALASA